MVVVVVAFFVVVVVVVVGRPNVINYKYRFIYIHEQQWKEC